MPPALALFFASAFVFYLLLVDTKMRPSVSSALWIPLTWFVVLGSRPVSFWFDASNTSAAPDAYMEGSPFDRLFFTLLIIVGLSILAKRRIRVHDVLSSNRALILFYSFWTISIIWSDFPAVTAKRLIKEFGNLIMVLVVLSERSRIDAIKAMFSRSTMILVPMSVVLIKYFPSLSRIYNQWTYEVMITGVTTNKNELGIASYLASLFLTWAIVDMRRDQRLLSLHTTRYTYLSYAALTIMTAWLVIASHSATSLACAAMGSIIILTSRTRPFNQIATYGGRYVFLTVILLIALDTIFNIKEILVTLLGRDLTLTTRTDLWQVVLDQPNNFLIGTGYNTFWLGERLIHVWERFDGIIQAHNGYLEVYLNGGAIGLSLLFVFLFRSWHVVKQQLALDRYLGAFAAAVFLTVLFHNVTEATFARHSSIWFSFLLVTISYSPVLPPRRNELTPRHVETLPNISTAPSSSELPLPS